MININDNNFKQEVLEPDLPVLVDFWAEWCAPCLMGAPIIKQIAEEYKGKLKVYKSNVDEAPNTVSRYGIMGIPTLAIFKDDKVVDKVVGALPKSELETTISNMFGQVNF